MLSPVSLIDPPGPWSPAEEWREFIAELETAEQTPQIIDELQQARAHLGRIEAAAGDRP
jgi:hypothetical protein